jgi:hypothetical protein
LFFAGKDKVHQSLRRLVKRLEKAEIPYAVMGAMALSAHRFRRTTDDVDVLLTPEGIDEFRRRFVPRYYEPLPKRSRRFVDRTNGVTLDILVAGHFPGSGEPGPIAFPDPTSVREVFQEVQVINLVTMIELKLAARRYKDFGDVVELIRCNDLDEFFANRLHKSVRRDFIECLEEKRREDEYDAQP